MYNNEKSVAQNTVIPLTSVGFIVFIVFLILKLCNVLPPEFTWFWVWFPLWLPWAIEGVLLIVTLIVALLMGLL